MQPQTVLEQFVKDFQQGLQQAAFNEAAKLGKGHCKNFEEYKKITGIIAGYDRAGTLASQMLKAMKDADVDDSELPEMTNE
jgi:hypothetical protein